MQLCNRAADLRLCFFSYAKSRISHDAAHIMWDKWIFLEITITKSTKHSFSNIYKNAQKQQKGMYKFISLHRQSLDSFRRVIVFIEENPIASDD